MLTQRRIKQIAKNAVRKVIAPFNAQPYLDRLAIKERNITQLVTQNLKSIQRLATELEETSNTIDEAINEYSKTLDSKSSRDLEKGSDALNSFRVISQQLKQILSEDFDNIDYEFTYITGQIKRWGS